MDWYMFLGIIVFMAGAVLLLTTLYNFGQEHEKKADQ